MHSIWQYAHPNICASSHKHINYPSFSQLMLRPALCSKCPSQLTVSIDVGGVEGMRGRRGPHLPYHMNTFTQHTYGKGGEGWSGREASENFGSLRLSQLKQVKNFREGGYTPHVQSYSMLSSHLAVNISRIKLMCGIYMVWYFFLPPTRSFSRFQERPVL